MSGVLTSKLGVIRVWHLVLFNLFFYVSGQFAALLFGGSLLAKNVFDIIFGLLFAVFLVLLLPQTVKAMRLPDGADCYKVITVGVFQSIVLFVMMILFQMFVTELFEYCSFCGDFFRIKVDFSESSSFEETSFVLMAAMFFRFVIVGPFEEELLYRVGMASVLYGRIGSLKGVVVIALIFASFHLTYFPYFFLFSLVLSSLVAKYRSVFPAFVAHGLYNFMVFFVLPPGKIVDASRDVSFWGLVLFPLAAGWVLSRAICIIKESSHRD
jgi:membrane protease YdiL (CAAX protease family)